MDSIRFLRYFLLMLWVFPLFGIEASAQIIDDKEVVPVVTERFNRSFRKSNDVVWEMKGNNYGVTFIFKGKPNYAEFDRTGRLTMQRTEVLLGELRPNTQDHLKRKYRSQVLRKAEFVQEHPNKKYYYVEMVPRRQKDDPDALVTKVYFSSTGMFQHEGEATTDGGNAQVEEKLDIPAAVLKEFNRRLKKPADANWMFVDTAYRVDYKMGNNDAYALFKPDGPWILTSVKMKAKFKNLHPGVQRWFAENMDAFTFQYAEDVSIAPNEKYFNIVVLDKNDDVPIGGQLMPTHLHFTKSGKHIGTFYPDYDVDELVVKEDKKWKKTASDAAVSGAAGNITGEREINRRELPSKAQEFLTKKYDHEWRTTTCTAMDDEEYGMLYYVVMKKQGQDLTFEHYFDIHGNLVGDEK
jgi:hypothetical protein